MPSSRAGEKYRKIYLFQFYIIKISFYQKALHRINPLSGYFNKYYSMIIKNLMIVMEDMLKANPWLANVTSKIFSHNRW